VGVTGTGTRSREANLRVPQLHLPPAGPALVLVGADDPALQQRLDAGITRNSTGLDVRTDSLWVEVTDGLHTLSTVVAIAGTRSDEVRFTHAAIDADADELMRLAVLAPSLVGLGRQLELGDFGSNPPSYEVRYQPIVDLQSARPLGFESLLRATAGKQILAGDELLAKVTNNELQDLDRFARMLAVQGATQWLGEGLLFMNIMAPDGSFDLDGAMATVRLATDAGFDPDQLVFEAVESNRYNSLGKAAEQLAVLRATGARVAVDDVGDGFASLRVVSVFKPEIVKITGGLVADLPSPESTTVIQAIVDMSHGMGAWVIAENIETETQREALIDLGVDWGQGHLLGPPSAPRIGADPRR
jgi:EAL domain-containing protein (putative c-di-GMP-specific phosphodiesterase class I)